MTSDRVGELADRLDRIVADLDDLAFDELRAAVGGEGDPRDLRAADRVLVRARRAVEKAAGLLHELADAGAAADGSDAGDDPIGEVQPGDEIQSS